MKAYIIVIAFTGPDAWDACYNRAHAAGLLKEWTVCEQVEIPSEALTFSLAPERSIRPKARP